MSFIRYPSLARLGNKEVEGIEHGTCYVFPKLDGTNASIWLDGEKICYGSRNRELSEENDNAGFVAAMKGDDRIREFFHFHPRKRLYGEWLVPHSFTGYVEDAWKKFYVFDVYDDETRQFVPYDTYRPWVNTTLDYIPCFWKVNTITEEVANRYSRECRFLLKQDANVGEGVVIKNYDWINAYGRVTWAKLVTGEFKTENMKVFGPVEWDGVSEEERIVELTVTTALVEKEYSKIVAENSGWSSAYIPRLLETVFFCVVTEELWTALKKRNFPTVNFKLLRSLCIAKVKQTKLDIF